MTPLALRSAHSQSSGRTLGRRFRCTGCGEENYRQFQMDDKSLALIGMPRGLPYVPIAAGAHGIPER
jgi:hypothetical protein